MNPETCEHHGILMTQFQNLVDRFEKLVGQFEALPVGLATITAQQTALAASILDLKDSNKEQWSAINSTRRLVWIGVGVCLALSATATVLATALSK